MQPDAILRRVWPGREVSWEPLSGGITNHNFKVTVDGGSFVLRIGGKDTELLGIDRRIELAATRMAFLVGVGPEVVGFVEPEGYLVTGFIVGVPIPVERMRAHDTIQRVAAAIRAIHEGPPIPGLFDAHRVVETYRDTAARHGVAVPPDFDWAHGISAQIEAARGPQPLVPCHNDFLNGNFLAEGGPDGPVRIVDWEYAGMGDRSFDLANFSINHEFEREHDDTLLAAYLGRDAEPRDFAALRLMRFMSDFREAMWGVVQQGISELDVDFVAYANEHFERLRATAAHPRFQDWLTSAAE